MATTWKRVLTEADLAANTGTVGASVADGEQGLVTGNTVFDYIADQNFGSGAGDIASVNQGNGIETSATAGGTAANVATGDAFIRVKPATDGGILVDSNGVSLDPTVAGDGLVLASGVLDVSGGDGITAASGAISVTVDDVSISLSASDGTGAVQVKDGGVTFAKLSSGAYVASGSQAGSSDSKLLTAGAIAESYPNVSLLAAQGTSHNYLTIAQGSAQGIVMNTINIADDTDLSASSGNTVQGQLNMALQGSEVGGTAFGLSTTSNVTFNDITGAGALTVNGNTTLGSATTDTVTISGNATIAGDLTVQGSTVTLEVATLTVEDKNIELASGSQTLAGANNAGISASTSSTAAHHPSIQWIGQGLALTGWSVENHNASRTTTGADLIPIAVMDINSDAPSSAQDNTGDLSAGVGSLWYDTTGDSLYIRTE